MPNRIDDPEHSLTIDDIGATVEDKKEEVYMHNRISAIAKGHLEMVLTWSIAKVFSARCPKEICFPDVGDVEAAKAAYKKEVYQVIASLNNAPVLAKHEEEKDNE